MTQTTPGQHNEQIFSSVRPAPTRLLSPGTIERDDLAVIMRSTVGASYFKHDSSRDDLPEESLQKISRVFRSVRSRSRRGL